MKLTVARVDAWAYGSGFVLLSLVTGRLWAAPTAHVSAAPVAAERNGTSMRWPFAAACREEVEAMLADVAPLARRVLAGASFEDTDAGRMGMLDMDACSAVGAIIGRVSE